jgi:hypothetical protein
MSPELETLDQLVGGDLPLRVIYDLFPDDIRFESGMSSLLRSGEIRLLAEDGAELPQWKWREVLAVPSNWPEIRVSLTPVGAQRIV